MKTSPLMRNSHFRTRINPKETKNVSAKFIHLYFIATVLIHFVSCVHSISLESYFLNEINQNIQPFSLRNDADELNEGMMIDEKDSDLTIGGTKSYVRL